MPDRDRQPGVRLSVGMLLPSGNVVAERQVQAMLAPGVVVHTTRLPLRGSSDAELSAMLDTLEDAARLLADARVDVVAFNCTAVSTFRPALEGEIAGRIEAATGTRAITTAEALVMALRRLGARRIALVTPYIEAVTAREGAYLSHHGFEVVREASYGIDLNWDMGKEPPETWLAFAADNRAEADACVLSCTAIHSASVIDAIEAAIGQPVVTSNQAIMWAVQRACGIDDPVAGAGALFRLPAA